MRTIEYCNVFPSEIEKILIDNHIVNGIGGSGGFDFELFFRNNIQIVDSFKEGKNLLSDFRRLSVVHDIAFLIGGNIFQFYYANFILMRDLYRLLGWISFIKRFIICCIFFICMNKYGKDYFNFKFIGFCTNTIYNKYR